MNRNLLRYIIVIGIISIIIITLFELIIMPFYVRYGKSDELINVKSMDIEAALIMIDAAGFRGVVTDTIFTNEVAPDIVLDQNPVAGSIVKKGRTVRLKISKAEKLVKVPYIIGQSQRSAELKLNKVGLRIGAISRKYSSIYPADVIIEQAPDSSATISKGFNVRVVISNGRSPNDIQVPDLFGLSKVAADNALQNAGLSLGKIRYKQNPDLIPFTVLDQSIQAGAVLDHPQSVDVTVSVLDLDDIFQDVVE